MVLTCESLLLYGYFNLQRFTVVSLHFAHRIRVVEYDFSENTRSPIYSAGSLRRKNSTLGCTPTLDVEHGLLIAVLVTLCLIENVYMIVSGDI